MSGQERPWWASDGPVDGGIARDEDPVERLRAARRGAADDAVHDGTAHDGTVHDGTAHEGLAEPWLDAVAATMSSLARAVPHPPPGDDEAADGARHRDPADTAPGSGDHQPDVCGVCPICVGLRTLAESRPELMGHLAEAARHVALAARSLRERSADEGDGAREGGARGDGRRGDRLEHIDLE